MECNGGKLACPPVEGIENRLFLILPFSQLISIHARPLRTRCDVAFQNHNCPSVRVVLRNVMEENCIENRLFLILPFSQYISIHARHSRTRCDVVFLMPPRGKGIFIIAMSHKQRSNLFAISRSIFVIVGRLLRPGVLVVT